MTLTTNYLICNFKRMLKIDSKPSNPKPLENNIRMKTNRIRPQTCNYQETGSSPFLKLKSGINCHRKINSSFLNLYHH